MIQNSPFEKDDEEDAKQIEDDGWPDKSELNWILELNRCDPEDCGNDYEDGIAEHVPPDHRNEVAHPAGAHGQNLF